MRKNLYYQTIDARVNLLKHYFLTFFLLFSSYPRLLLEVFTRKEFGERYFRLSAAITLTVILALLPIFVHGLFDLAELRFSVFMGHYLTWYIFLALFMLVSVRHYQAMRRGPSVYDFTRYSLSRGEINPAFFNVQLPGQKPGRKTDIRLVETLIEPTPFFLAGVILWLLHQKLGILLTVSSLFYGFSYAAAYSNGDNFVMDKIDEMICNEELKRAFVDDLDTDETRGFRFMGRKPKDTEMRRQILPLMMEEDEEVFEAV